MLPQDEEDYTLQDRIRVMKESPALSYVVTCAFLFYVFMCASTLDTLVGYNMQKYINRNVLARHALGLVVLIFTIGVVTNISSVGVILGAGVAVYTWFVIMTELPGQWNVVVVLLLMACFVLNSIVQRKYTPEWVYAAPGETLVSARERTREKYIHAVYLMGWIILFLSAAMCAWFFSEKRLRAVYAFVDNHREYQQWVSKNHTGEWTRQMHDHLWMKWIEAEGPSMYSKNTSIKDALWLFTYQPYSKFVDVKELWAGTQLQAKCNVQDMATQLLQNKAFLRAMQQKLQAAAA